MKTKPLFAVLSAAAVMAAITCAAQPASLIVRADDIGMSHASNEGVIGSYTNGIVTSAELMVVTPWLPEAAQMLAENPGFDVGVHIAFTSEWSGLKWRPLTPCPSLTDEYGYFYPFIFPNASAPGRALMELTERIDIAEVEAELRAQIDLALKLVPRVSHISGHMGWAGMRADIAEMANRVAAEYGLVFVDGTRRPVFESLGMPRGATLEERTANFLAALGRLEAGKTYLYVEHPALEGPEMHAVGHPGYENVAEDRQAVYDMFTSPRAKAIIAEQGIELVSYGEIFAR